MQVKILEEHGYNSALYGFSLSYKDRAISPKDWWGFCEECDGYPKDHYGSCQSCESHMADKGIWARVQKITKTATANAPRGKGHNKFLRQVILWLDIEAPRYWWSEMDTYKVGTVAQSESTMHTLSKRNLTEDDFEGMKYPEFIYLINKARERQVSVQELKGMLPESYLQRRVLTCNYETLRNIIAQRKNHKLPEWSIFITAIVEQVEHPELLEDLI